jgi:hypothetical protein
MAPNSPFLQLTHKHDTRRQLAPRLVNAGGGQSKEVKKSPHIRPSMQREDKQHPAASPPEAHTNSYHQRHGSFLYILSIWFHMDYRDASMTYGVNACCDWAGTEDDARHGLVRDWLTRARASLFRASYAFEPLSPSKLQCVAQRQHRQLPCPPAPATTLASTS